jgi:hypothetical protein
MGRQLQARESRLQMLRRVTMDERGNSVLSDDVTLESLGTLLCFSARQFHVGWRFSKLLYYIILSSIPLQHKEKCSTTMLYV